jgi:hypothetical protein
VRAAVPDRCAPGAGAAETRALVIPPGGTRAEREPILADLCVLAPRLLSVERVAPRYSATSGAARRIVLRLDRTVLEVASERGTPVIRPVVPGDDVQGEGTRADQEEPWWAVLGAPLLGCWRVTTATSATVALQMRDDLSNPKIISIAADGESVRATGEPKARWLSRLG